MGATTPKHAVALVDDHTLVRKGLVGLISSLGDYEVVLEAGNGKEFQKELSGGPHVDIAIVDLHMPVMDGYDTIAWIKETSPELRAIALTFEHSEDAVIRAVRSGARGFILKDIEPLELKCALDSLMLTGYYHTDLVQSGLMNSFGGRTAQEREQARVLGMITPRELEFLKLVCSAEEPTYERIGDVMDVHRRTVDGYRQALFDKFDIKSKTGLVLFAMKWGIVKP